MNSGSDYSRREFIKKNALGCAGVVLGSVLGGNISAAAARNAVSVAGQAAADGPLKIAVFDVDATPPVGSYLTYDQMANVWDMGLRAKGIVLTGAGAPVVICAIDWIGIANESQDVFKKTLADAVQTDPKRVVVHTLHQHDAPICDFSVEKMLKELNMEPMSFESSFAREFLVRLGKAAEDSLNRLRPVTDISIGKAPVYKVASNRRIVKDGKVGAMRATTCTDPAMRDEPEGLIDPDVTLLAFWEGDKPVVIMTFYATHPQSYYLTKIANPDFPGVARFYRQLAVPDALHIHFTGAGANIGAGKYNDGSHENRLILARRLAEGMEHAWKYSTKMPVSAGEVTWKTEPVLLPIADGVIQRVESRFRTADMRYRSNNMPMIIWAKRTRSGIPIDIACLRIGKAGILFTPGELCVEYQLAAKAFRPDLAVSMAAYGDYGPFYICAKEAYSQGGYEVNESPVTEDSEEILMNAFRKLLV